ncbi:hypothetical protein [Croceicoccus sp. YJ47]|uniref:hypothetical protein n=1 Tax=Croceicoccus sp. YJ47 TaxID=2798724 RepID=UPI001924B1B6|nr:hypothetical protein [Croceicoccus sp. YJ47]QQN74806.1 hypothetical protein JD971_03525 [Croceicoccus sp. YJ47]
MSDPAARRFFVIQAVRVAGVVVAVWGLSASYGRAPWLGGAPAWVGALVLAAGTAVALIGPRLLARKWRSGS